MGSMKKKLLKLHVRSFRRSQFIFFRSGNCDQLREVRGNIFLYNCTLLQIGNKISER